MSRAVVIGGGITGTLSAVALLDAGYEVVLLEGRHVGAGSSSRTAAGIRQQFSTRETVIGMRYSVQSYRDWAHGPQSPIQQNGYLFLFDDEGSWEAARERVEAQRSWGLSEVQAQGPDALPPWVDGAVGGTFCPTDGFLRPEVVYNDASEAVRARGRVVQNAEVVAAEHAGGRLRRVQARGEWFEGDVFFDCTNAWTRRLGPILGGVDLPVEALKRYLWFLERGHALSAETLLSMPLVISPSGAYCRPENANSLMLGWKHDARDESASFSYEDQDEIEVEHYHKSGIDARPYEAWMALAEVIPELADFAGISATTGGFYATTPDHNPFLDVDPQVPNLVRLVGFSGHGAMFGPFTAQAAVALARGEDCLSLLGEQVSLKAFRIGRAFAHAEAMVI